MQRAVKRTETCCRSVLQMLKSKKQFNKQKKKHQQTLHKIAALLAQDLETWRLGVYTG